MDYGKTKLTPIEKPKQEATTAAEDAARAELERLRRETEKYKQRYFDYYDDVKINHREDW